MTSALVVESATPGPIDLVADLAAVGIEVLGPSTRRDLVRDTVRHGPDLIACFEASVDDALFTTFAQLAATAPCAVLVFTNDPDATKIERALRAGIHAYVINGYGRNRLRPLMHLAEARFQHDRALRDELTEVSQRFDERKLVDRAKGILMRARQLGEDEAFRVLRTASMHSGRRVGQVAQQVIAAAHYAEGLNRAGRLRMLSQRLVRMVAADSLPDDTIALIDTNIGALGKSLSRASFGDLLDAVEAAWPPLRALASSRPAGASITPARLLEIDRLAEQLLTHADQLTQQLEAAGLVTSLHVINISGRQRMWSQRFAKQALTAMLLSGEVARRARDDLDQTALAFDQAMDYLRGLPLSTREIRDLLDQAEEAWHALREAAPQVRSASGQRALGAASDALLGLFDRLTDHYERSLQVLMG